MKPRAAYRRGSSSRLVIGSVQTGFPNGGGGPASPLSSAPAAGLGLAGTGPPPLHLDAQPPPPSNNGITHPWSHLVPAWQEELEGLFRVLTATSPAGLSKVTLASLGPLCCETDATAIDKLCNTADFPMSSRAFVSACIAQLYVPAFKAAATSSRRPRSAGVTLLSAEPKHIPFSLTVLTVMRRSKLGSAMGSSQATSSMPWMELPDATAAPKISIPKSPAISRVLRTSPTNLEAWGAHNSVVVSVTGPSSAMGSQGDLATWRAAVGIKVVTKLVALLWDEVEDRLFLQSVSVKGKVVRMTCHHGILMILMQSGAAMVWDLSTHEFDHDDLQHGATRLAVLPRSACEGMATIPALRGHRVTSMAMREDKAAAVVGDKLYTWGTPGPAGLGHTPVEGPPVALMIPASSTGEDELVDELDGDVEVAEWTDKDLVQEVRVIKNFRMRPERRQSVQPTRRRSSLIQALASTQAAVVFKEFDGARLPPGVTEFMKIPRDHFLLQYVCAPDDACTGAQQLFGGSDAAYDALRMLQTAAQDVRDAIGEKPPDSESTRRKLAGHVHEILQEAWCKAALVAGPRIAPMPRMRAGSFTPAQVCMAMCHTTVMSQEGQVATWGCSMFDVLGAPCDKEVCPTLQLLRLPGASARAMQIACGDYHTAVVLFSGQLLTWGSGEQGQTGHGTFEPCPAPKVVSQLTGTVVHVACGASHTVALDSKGVVWCAGSNVRGQLGVALSAARLAHHSHGIAHGLKKSASRPAVKHNSLSSPALHEPLACAASSRFIQPSGLEDTRISHVDCCDEATVAVAEDGKLFAWGRVVAESHNDTAMDPETGADYRDQCRPTPVPWPSMARYASSSTAANACVSANGRIVVVTMIPNSPV